jgi:hypothetical protein
VQTHWGLTIDAISNTFVGDASERSVRWTAGLTSALGFVSGTVSIRTGQRVLFGASVEVWALGSTDTVFTSGGAVKACSNELESEIAFFLSSSADTVLAQVWLVKVFATSEWWAVVLLLTARTISTKEWSHGITSDVPVYVLLTNEV